MDADVTGLARPKGRHDAARTAVRHGTGPGSVTLGGRRVGVERPQVRAADGSWEMPVPAYELFSSTELLGRLAMEKMQGCRPGATRSVRADRCQGRRAGRYYE